MNAPFATLWRADQPLARCVNCGAQRQFHGRPNFSCTDFRAETADDIDPADLNNRDLVRHIYKLMAKTEHVEDTPAHDADELRLCSCRSELEDRIEAVFGDRWDGIRGAMGW